jgi:hypothetical protein
MFLSRLIFRDLKDYKRFLYLGDNTVVYGEDQGTQLLQSKLQIGPYILVLSVWFVVDLADISSTS